MVVKKKGLYLGLWLLLLGIGNVMQANDVQTYDIHNRTPYTIRVRIDYYGNCNKKYHFVKVDANKSMKIKAKLRLCPVKKWTAFVYDDEVLAPVGPLTPVGPRMPTWVVPTWIGPVVRPVVGSRVPTRVGPIEYTKEDALKFVTEQLIIEFVKGRYLLQRVKGYK